MQIAYKKADNPNDRRVYLRGISRIQYEAVTVAGFAWNKKGQYFEGTPSLFMLVTLSNMVRLPPELQALKNELEGNQRAINSEKIKANDQIIDNAPAPVRAKLYAHQVKALHLALKRFESGSGFGLLMGMGAGKSLTSIAIMGSLFEAQKIKRVLVVCPSSIVSVWEKEVKQFAAFPYSLRALQGKKAERIAAIQELIASKWGDPPLNIAVINYESVHREGINEALQAYNADLIICDESQRIKSNNAAQSKAMHKLGDKARYKLILSGTPVQNNAIDLYSQYRFLDSSIFGTNFYSFKARYTVSGGFQNKQIVGYKNLDELIKKAHSIAYRVTLDECVDLPDQIFINRSVSLSEKEMAAYKDLKDLSVAELEGGTITAQTVLTKILRLQQFTGGFVSDDDGNIKQTSKAKLDALTDIIDDYIPTGKKAVIFARFTAELEAIKKILESKGLKYGFIDGSVAQEKRGAIVDTFQNDPECKVFLGQLQTVSTGLTLTASNLMIFYSVSFNYADFSQACARIHRIGQKEKCTYINLICENTIDEKVFKALEKKEDTARSIVDNWREYFE